jgi:hydroxymethylbilane synthase
LFTSEIEKGLLDGHIDLAVHSLKDLPTSSPPGLTIGAIPLRAAVEDVLVSRDDYTLETLPVGAAVGTSSYRRAAQLLVARPDLKCIDLRGNVDTRLRKALDLSGPYDAIALARAGLQRLGQEHLICQILPLDVVLPAPGQGALAVQCRDEAVWLRLLKPLEDSVTRAAVTAERAFLAGLGGGCSVPVAAYGCVEQTMLDLLGRVSSLDGTRQVDVHVTGPAVEAEDLGWKLAKSALAQGAAEFLETTA